MSSSTITVIRCDRCSAELTLAEDGVFHSWGRIAARQNQGPAHIGPDSAAAGGDDLCAACFRALIDWYVSTSAPLDQPVPPAPPPRPSFTLDDRKRAIDIAEATLRDQVAASLEVVREEPTSILTGDLLPGALTGARQRAERLVDGILGQLGLGKRRARS